MQSLITSVENKYRKKITTDVKSGDTVRVHQKIKEGSKEHEASDLLVQEAERLNRSITELLNYARPTTLRKEPVNIGEMLDLSLKLISSDAQALGVTISLNIEPDIPAVSVDRDRINQVLLNLYLNGLALV